MAFALLTPVLGPEERPWRLYVLHAAPPLVAGTTPTHAPTGRWQPDSKKCLTCYDTEVQMAGR